MRDSHSFTGLLALQARVLGAMVLRETRATFGSSSVGYLWAIITPTASVLVLVAIFTLADRQPPFGSSFALFFGAGVLTLELFNKLSNTLMGAFEANRGIMAYPPIKTTDPLFARLILIAATYVLVMALFFGTLIATGLADPPRHPERVAAAFLTTALMGFGFGVTNAVIVSLWQSWREIERVLTRPLLFISGVFYVPSLLPTQAVEILKWNPVLHLVEWFRTGWYMRYPSRILDETYALSVAFGLLLLGLALERLFRKKRT